MTEGRGGSIAGPSENLNRERVRRQHLARLGINKNYHAPPQDKEN